MDPEAFLDIANQVVKLKMFPYFDIAHCVLCALSVREDLGTGKNWMRASERRDIASAGFQFGVSSLSIIIPNYTPSDMKY